jgi:hypothetical protein
MACVLYVSHKHVKINPAVADRASPAAHTVLIGSNFIHSLIYRS